MGRKITKTFYLYKETYIKQNGGVDKWKKKRYGIEIPRFTGGNIPVNVAARIMKKDAQYVRQGIILGFLKFGVAFKKEGSTQYDYYISPMKFWQETGYIYDGKED